MFSTFMATLLHKFWARCQQAWRVLRGSLGRPSPKMREIRRTEAGEDFLKYVCDAGGSLPRRKMAKAMRRLNLDEATLAAAIGRLALDGMLTVGEQFTLTPKGREAALKLIRAHRIYEQYLAEHSGYSPTEWHQRAHRMEHHISKDEQERYVSLLGNPLYDPHGDPIPTDSLAMAPARHTAQSPLPNTYWRIAHVEDDDEDIFQRILQTGLAKDAVIHVLSINGKHFSFRYEGETFQLPTKTLGALDLLPLTEEEALAESPLETFRLYHLKLHQKARIIGLSPACRGALRRRLLDLGFVRGSRVAVAMHSPMGNPTAYVVRGTTIALRQDQARYILAVPASCEGTQKDEQSSKAKV